MPLAAGSATPISRFKIVRRLSERAANSSHSWAGAFHGQKPSRRCIGGFRHLRSLGAAFTTRSITPETRV